MAYSRFLTAGLLGLISISAIYFTIIGSSLNGLTGLLESWQQDFPSLLPFSTPEEPVYFRRVYTGIEPFDMFISRLTPLFWPLINGQKIELTLFGVYMFGQIWASETLLIVEGCRVGNMGRAISYSTIWGLALQILPWGFVQPLYGVFHLLSSPIAQFTAAPSPAMISASFEAVKKIPLLLTTQYGLPSILMCLPAPSMISHDTKQKFLIAWQLFPIWVGLGVYVAQELRRHFAFPAQHNPLRSVTHSRAVNLRGLREIYAIAIAVAVLTHLGTIFLTILLVLLNSHLSSYLPAFFLTPDAGAVFRPWPTIPNFAHYGRIPQVADIAEGFLVLLQYNTIFAGLGLLVWAMWLSSRVGGRGSGLRAMWFGILATALMGPCGAAVGLMWMRDEDVFEGSSGEGGQKKE